MSAPDQRQETLREVALFRQDAAEVRATWEPGTHYPASRYEAAAYLIEVLAARLAAAETERNEAVRAAGLTRQDVMATEAALAAAETDEPLTVSRLTRDNQALKEGLAAVESLAAGYAKALVSMTDKKRKAEERLAAAETALQKYGEHRAGCAYAENPSALPSDCDCGLTTALASPDAAAPSVCSRCAGTDPGCYICAQFKSPDAAAVSKGCAYHIVYVEGCSRCADAAAEEGT